MEIRYSKAAVKAINSFDKSTKQRIHEGIIGLTEHPPKGNIKPLAGYDDKRYRLRIGKFRIIYKFLVDNTIEILYIMDIGSRGDIYK